MLKLAVIVSILASSSVTLNGQWANLKLVSLECVKTEDWTGDDKIYIEVNREKHIIGVFNKGDIIDIDLVFSFKNSICIRILEDDPDFLDGDDFLGEVCPDYADKSAGSDILSTIKYGLSGCKYILRYRVY